MGAHSASAYGAHADVGVAYEKAVDEAGREYGSDPYNGTITTSSGYFIGHRVPVSMAEARRLEAATWEREDDGDGYATINGQHLSKWEAWAAIPIADDSGYTTRTKKVTLTDKVEKWGYGGTPIEPALKAKLALTAGETLVDIKILEDRPVWKPVVTTPQGEREIIYQVVSQHGGLVAEAATIAAARKVAIALAKDHGKPRKNYDGKLVVDYDGTSPSTWQVKGVVRRRHNGNNIEPMLVVGTVISSRKTTFEATITKTKAGSTPKVKGWYFFGMAAS